MLTHLACGVIYRPLPHPRVASAGSQAALRIARLLPCLRGTALARARPCHYELLRHPLAIVLLSFVLTSVLGVAFSQWISDRAKEAEQARSETETRKAAVQNLSRSIYERRARADMLASSFFRGAQLDEIKSGKSYTTKRSCDGTPTIKPISFSFVKFCASMHIRSSRAAWSFTLIDKIFRPLDVCLTQAYDAAVSGNSAMSIVQECQVRKLLQDALDCGYAIADELYKLSSNATIPYRAASEIAARCPK